MHQTWALLALNHANFIPLLGFSNLWESILGGFTGPSSTKFGFMFTKLTMNQNSIGSRLPLEKHWCTTLIWSWASWLLCRHIHSRLFDDYFENRRMIMCLLRVSRLMASPHSLRTGLVFRLLRASSHYQLQYSLSSTIIGDITTPEGLKMNTRSIMPLRPQDQSDRSSPQGRPYDGSTVLSKAFKSNVSCSLRTGSTTARSIQIDLEIFEC